MPALSTVLHDWSVVPSEWGYWDALCCASVGSDWVVRESKAPVVHSCLKRALSSLITTVTVAKAVITITIRTVATTDGASYMIKVAVEHW